MHLSQENMLEKPAAVSLSRLETEIMPVRRIKERSFFFNEENEFFVQVCQSE